jgi:hypothetical protein
MIILYLLSAWHLGSLDRFIMQLAKTATADKHESDVTVPRGQGAFVGLTSTISSITSLLLSKVQVQSGDDSEGTPLRILRR